MMGKVEIKDRCLIEKREYIECSDWLFLYKLFDSSRKGCYKEGKRLENMEKDYRNSGHLRTLPVHHLNGAATACNATHSCLYSMVNSNPMKWASNQFTIYQFQISNNQFIPKIMVMQWYFKILRRKRKGFLCKIDVTSKFCWIIESQKVEPKGRMIKYSYPIICKISAPAVRPDSHKV